MLVPNKIVATIPPDDKTPLEDDPLVYVILRHWAATRYVLRYCPTSKALVLVNDCEPEPFISYLFADKLHLGGHHACHDMLRRQSYYTDWENTKLTLDTSVMLPAPLSHFQMQNTLPPIDPAKALREQIEGYNRACLARPKPWSRAG